MTKHDALAAIILAALFGIWGLVCYAIGLEHAAMWVAK